MSQVEREHQAKFANGSIPGRPAIHHVESTSLDALDNPLRAICTGLIINRIDDMPKINLVEQR